MSTTRQTELNGTDESDDNCDCADLPGQWPCAECHISVEKELPVDAEAI